MTWRTENPLRRIVTWLRDGPGQNLALDSRRVVHVALTSPPTLAWLKQQLRDATPWAVAPRFLLHDNDGVFGQFRRDDHAGVLVRGKHYRSALDRWLSADPWWDRARLLARCVARGTGSNGRGDGRAGGSMAGRLARSNAPNWLLARLRGPRQPLLMRCDSLRDPLGDDGLARRDALPGARWLPDGVFTEYGRCPAC